MVTSVSCGTAAVALAFLALAVPRPAAADTLIASAPGARNLAAGHGYLAWAAPASDGRWRLKIRTPDGTVGAARVATFGATPDPTIGRVGGRTVVGYTRCAGGSATRRCDVLSYDVRSRTERRVPALATKAYSETAPDLDASGRWSFVRRSGPRNGVHLLGGRRVRRVARRVASETALTPHYVAFVDPTPYTDNGCCTLVRAVRRSGGRLISFGSPVGTIPRALTAAGDRAFWLDTAHNASGTIPLDPEGRGHRNVTTPAAYNLPATTTAIAATESTPNLYLDAEGIKRVDRPLYPPLG